MDDEARDPQRIAREHERAAEHVRIVAAQYSSPSVVGELLKAAMRLEAAAESWRVLAREVLHG